MDIRSGDNEGFFVIMWLMGRAVHDPRLFPFHFFPPFSPRTVQQSRQVVPRTSLIVATLIGLTSQNEEGKEML